MRIAGRKLGALSLLLCALLILCGASCERKEILQIGGSTTVQPLAEKWAEAFERRHPEIEVRVQGGGSSFGVRGCAEGILDIGAASRELSPEEKERWPELVPIPVALDAIAIVVNPQNPREDITLDELREIFAAGTTDEWIAISRDPGSGTREVFEEKVMRGAPISSRCEFYPSNGAVREAVARNPKAIGYISLGYVNEAVKALRVNGVACTPENVREGKYPLVRTLYFITRGEPRGKVKEFVDFCLGEEGQEIAEKEGYVRVK